MINKTKRDELNKLLTKYNANYRIGNIITFNEDYVIKRYSWDRGVKLKKNTRYKISACNYQSDIEDYKLHKMTKDGKIYPYGKNIRRAELLQIFADSIISITDTTEQVEGLVEVTSNPKGLKQKDWYEIFKYFGIFQYTRFPNSTMNKLIVTGPAIQLNGISLSAEGSSVEVYTLAKNRKEVFYNVIKGLSETDISDEDIDDAILLAGIK